VFDGGLTDDGRPYLVMEYVEGKPIDQFCDDGRLGIGDRLRLFIDVCQAVHYAHQKLIVHRDLKPANVFVSKDGRPRLLDFGIAKLLERGDEARETRTGWRPMTPAYASPEQARGDPITTAVDVYALGVLLYELLTGRLPHEFSGLNPVQIARVLEDVTPAAPSAVVKGSAPQRGDGDQEALRARARLRGAGVQTLERKLAGDLDEIVLKALHRDPRRRYSSASALAVDITRHLQGRPVAARADTLGYKLSRFLGRHPAGTGLAVTIVLSLFGLVATMRIQSDRISHERDRAERVTELLGDVLASADPTVVPGEELTVREALDRAVERLQSEPEENDPLVYTRLIGVIASAYDNLDAHDRAVELSTDAVDRLRNAVPSDHPLYVESLNRLGGVLMHAGRGDEAVDVLAEALDIARDLRAERPIQLASTLNSYGLALHARGQAEAAEPLYLEALEIYDGLGSPRDSAVEVVVANLGWAAHARADWETAESRFRDVVGMRLERLGPNHPRTAIARLNLSDVLNRRGQTEPAYLMADSALATIRVAYPDGHSQLANALRINASLLTNLGRLDEAAETLEEALVIYRGNETSYGSAIRYATNQLARIRERQGRLDEALDLYTTSAEGFARAVGESHPFTAVVHTNIAWVEHNRGRNEQAEKIFRQVIPVLDSAWAGTPSIALTLVNFSSVLAAEGKCHEAVPVLQRAEELELRQFPEDHDRVVRARRILGGCLIDLGRLEEAEAPLLSAYRSLLATRGTTDGFSIAAGGDLARLYELWGKKEQAAEYAAVSQPPPM
jgi:serine/threonine-protein kinase